MSQENDKQLITEAREWEGTAETIRHHTDILNTVVDSVSIKELPELESVLRLVEHTAEELYSLFLKCKSKHESITASRFVGEVSHG